MVPMHRPPSRISLPIVAPGEQTLLLVVGAIVGVHAGLATGLFANAIAFFHLLFFRTSLLVETVLPGAEGVVWRARFADELAHARWHPEFLVAGGAGIVL